MRALRGLQPLRRLRAISAGGLLFATSASFAPFQCASEIDPNRQREEEPGEALYGLAEQFKAKGDQDARVATLRYIVKRYPSSRFAEMARLDLEEIPVPATLSNDTPKEAPRSTERSQGATE